MVFDSPADIRGTAFLTWEHDDPAKEDDKWLYMPALKKVRRISGSSKKEYFMGSDFTYDDMGDRNVDEDIHTLRGEESVNGHDCWKIESVPVDPEDAYTHKHVYVDKAVHIVVKAEYFDKDGLLKVYQAFDVQQKDGFWTVVRSEMDNQARNHKTILELGDIQYNKGIKDHIFKVSAIQRGRIR
jgi:hypothetical protein